MMTPPTPLAPSGRGGTRQPVDRTYGASAAGGTDAGAGPRHGARAGCEADPTWGGRVTFTRDAHGRPYEMSATITRDMFDEGTEARGSLRPPGFLGGDYNQARGHLLARMLGGSGDTLDNLFAITQNPTNTQDMRDWEQAIYNSVKKHGHATYNVYLEYSDDKKDSVPKYIQLEAYDRHGKVIVDTMLDNPAWNQQQRRRQGLLP
ncbi:DNA/RNA non-specific endonuclease [Streptomyces exfoliatus]|uniref:DNA/RNA non-specific endonuclease n=1 Tax=Streptomyces exfoliatus TaxID=1905 RepID=UPI003C2BBE2B